MSPRTVKTIYEGAGVKGIKRAPKEVLERIAWVRPQSVFGPEWEVRHPQVGDHLVRNRKYFSMKEFASALRSRLVVSVVPASMGGSRIYDAILAGKRVGSISVHDRFARDLFGNITGKKTPKISRSNVDEQFRGMGIGKKLYSEVIKKEGRVMSDSSVSGEARRVYESLKKNKNIKIRTFPATETPGELVGRNGVYQQRPPGLSNGFGWRPVFAVQWKGRKDLSAKLRLREFVRVMGGADIPASMSQIRSVWRTFKNAAPGKIVRSTTQGSSFGPRGMVVQKAASGAKIDREALLAGATNTTNYPITSALHEGGHALFNKAMTGSANQQFLPRLGRGPTPEKHPLRGVQIMANEIGANNSAVQVLRGAGVKQDAVSDFMKFRQRGIDSHMRSARDHVAAAPVGLTPQRHQEIKGAFNRWITDWKRSPASPNAKLSVDAPELVKKDFEAAKLRLRELARGDYAIPALGKMLKDRSFLEEFLTGKRGPKLGDLVAVKEKSPRNALTWARDVIEASPSEMQRDGGIKLINEVGRGNGWKTYPAPRDEIRPLVSVMRNEGFRYLPNSKFNHNRNAIAKMLRKGRAGGDVYEEVVRS